MVGGWKGEARPPPTLHSVTGGRLWDPCESFAVQHVSGGTKRGQIKCQLNKKANSNKQTKFISQPFRTKIVISHLVYTEIKKM